MRTTRTITASLAAVLGAAALAGPAAAAPADSAHSIYVPPATYPMKAHVYVPPASLATAPKSDVTANVYVPPANTVAPVQKHAATTSASSSNFDWDSAGIGAGAAIVAALAGFAAAMGLRRRPATSS